MAASPKTRPRRRAATRRRRGCDGGQMTARPKTQPSSSEQEYCPRDTSKRNYQLFPSGSRSISLS
eukprot:1431216-Pyramimonas_sp.AAC.1